MQDQFDFHVQDGVFEGHEVTWVIPISGNATLFAQNNFEPIVGEEIGILFPVSTASELFRIGTTLGNSGLTYKIITE